MAKASALLEALPAVRLRYQTYQRYGGAPSQATATPLWTPLDGPQTQALESQADELYYGGGAGGGKSYLLLGYGVAAARFGIIFRRQFKQLLGPEGLIETSKQIVGKPTAFNNSTMIWHIGERQLEFGACDHEDDKFKYQGRAHDYKGFDEVAQFTESQYLYLSGWARTTTVGQRVRIIACGNPPQNAEGEWVIERWSAWLDGQHPNPARPGELRWYVRGPDNEDIEVDGPEPVTISGTEYHPLSRTFIPARVTDNPFLMATDYLARLQAFPEPLRTQLIFGDHGVGVQDDVWQVIPTAWVRAAQERWTPTPPKNVPLTSVGFDIAQGGNDETTIARRYGRWFAELESIPGPEVPDASVNAEHVERVLALGGVGYVDSDGIGASTYFLAKPTLGARLVAFKGSAPATHANGKPLTDASGVLTFLNVRAAAYWRLREALDPSAEHPIALPPSRDLRVQLCAARYIAEDRTVKLEKKEKIKERLGRSPDDADAVVMALWDDPDAALAEAFAKESAPVREPSILEQLRSQRPRGRAR